MKYKKNIMILLVISFIATLVIFYFFTEMDPNWLLTFSLSLIFFILLFTKEAVFNAWKKFGIWYIPLAAILIFLAPSDSGGSFGFSMGIDREGATMFLSAIFLIASLIIIILKSIKARKQKTAPIQKKP